MSQFGLSRRCGVAGGERVPPVQLGWYWAKNYFEFRKMLVTKKSRVQKNVWSQKILGPLKKRSTEKLRLS